MLRSGAEPAQIEEHSKLGIPATMVGLSSDAVWEILRWLDDRAPWHWLVLLLAAHHDLRRPLPLLTPAELFDRTEDAFAYVVCCYSFDSRELAAVAAEVGHTGAFRRHAPPTMSQEELTAMFHVACKSGHLSLAECMIQWYDWPRPAAIAALHETCKHGHLSLTKYLVQRVDLAADELGACSRAFVFACENGHQGLARWLLEEYGVLGEDTEATRIRSSVFSLACRSGCLDLAKWLAAHFKMTGADVRSYSNHAFRKTCLDGRLEVAKWLAVEYALTLEDVTACENSSHRWASLRGHHELVAWLEEKYGVS